MANQDSDSPAPAAPAPGYRGGPKLDHDAMDRMQSINREAPLGATWRGWVIGLLGVVALSVFIPYADFAFLSSNLSFNAFPMFSVVLMVLMILAMNLAVRFFKTSLGLTRQDLTLVFVMTMVSYAIPGVGFWCFWSVGMTGASYYETSGNKWLELYIKPYMGGDFFPHDPPEGVSGARPVEWFYNGLPHGEGVPYMDWVGPYWRWMIVVAFMYGIYFAVAMILRKRWSEQERLPFPVAQVPAEMLEGVGVGGGRTQKGFFSHGLVWAGVALTFIIHSYNVWSTYDTRVPQLKLMNWNLQNEYFTEQPWKSLGALHVHFYPSLIALTYLLSLEVAFSLWFFYFIQKGVNFFFAETVGGSNLSTIYYAQGIGALLMMVALGLWAARSELGQSFLRALGRGSTEEEEEVGDVHPRVPWAMLVVSVAGVVWWMTWFGIDVQWALALVILFILTLIGFARLIAEAGVFATQIYYFPIDQLTLFATPAALGAKNHVLTTVWDRMFTADWFRVVPLPNIMNSFHLASQTGLRTRTAFGGMSLAIMLMFAISLPTFLHMAYKQGGVNGMGWFFNGYPQWEFKKIGDRAQKLDGWKQKQEKFAAENKPMPDSEIPQEAKHEWDKLGWFGFGGLVMAVFVFARQYLFWWPHPAGYVMWMSGTIDRLWWSFFLGWMFKWAISKYGGMRIYNASRKFFIGLVVGECLAAVFWAIFGLFYKNKEMWRVTIGLIFPDA